MAISVELNEISDLDIKRKIETAIRGCIGDRLKEGDWKVWIRDLAGPCQVTVVGPTQTRERFFYDDIRTLPEKIRNWLESYPLR